MNSKKWTNSFLIIKNKVFWLLFNNFSALLLWKINFLEIFSMVDFFSIFVVTRSIPKLWSYQTYGWSCLNPRSYSYYYGILLSLFLQSYPEYMCTYVTHLTIEIISWTLMSLLFIFYNIYRVGIKIHCWGRY